MSLDTWERWGRCQMAPPMGPVLEPETRRTHASIQDYVPEELRTQVSLLPRGLCRARVRDVQGDRSSERQLLWGKGRVVRVGTGVPHLLDSGQDQRKAGGRLGLLRR
jgi:hypothetical protein